jgi:hypothetical protein
MNIWTEKSIELASQKNYLDLLYKVYPMSINLKRSLNDSVIATITEAFENRNSQRLLEVLLKLEIFPIKDSYVAYLKRDKSAIERNPATVERITGMLYEMGYEEIIDRATLPKETNRQIGPLFKRWVASDALGVKVTDSTEEFMTFQGNVIYNAGDAAMMNFATNKLGYRHTKGLDFIAKFNNKYVIAETKFLTDFGGHQNAQFSDAINTMKAPLDTKLDVVTIAILDGVLFIKGNNKMYKTITTGFDDNDVIISATLLRDYLFTL